MLSLAAHVKSLEDGIFDLFFRDRKVHKRPRCDPQLRRLVLMRTESCLPCQVRRWPIATLPQEFMSEMPPKAEAEPANGPKRAWTTAFHCARLGPRLNEGPDWNAESFWSS